MRCARTSPRCAPISRRRPTPPPPTGRSRLTRRRAARRPCRMRSISSRALPARAARTWESIWKRRRTICLPCTGSWRSCSTGSTRWRRRRPISRRPTKRQSRPRRSRRRRPNTPPTRRVSTTSEGRSSKRAKRSARELFTDFLAKFPKDDLASNSQYWLGETYYAERKWNDAIGELQKVLKEYKGSEKVPDALLKIGMSFQAQNDCGNAILFFEELQQGHRSTDAAKSAKAHIVECKKKK